MAKRAGLIASGVTLVLLIWPFVFGMADSGGDALTPPVAELLIWGLSFVLIFALTFAIAYAVQWRRRRRTAS